MTQVYIRRMLFKGRMLSRRTVKGMPAVPTCHDDYALDNHVGQAVVRVAGTLCKENNYPRSARNVGQASVAGRRLMYGATCATPPVAERACGSRANIEPKRQRNCMRGRRIVFVSIIHALLSSLFLPRTNLMPPVVPYSQRVLRQRAVKLLAEQRWTSLCCKTNQNASS